MSIPLPRAIQIDVYPNITGDFEVNCSSNKASLWCVYTFGGRQYATAKAALRAASEHASASHHTDEFVQITLQRSLPIGTQG